MSEIQPIHELLFKDNIGLSQQDAARMRERRESVFGLLPDALFMADMGDLFMRRRSGHAVKHIFSGGALDLWEEFTKAATNYYPSHAEAELIKNHTDFYATLAQESRKTFLNGHGDKAPLVVIELGPGSATAVHSKTIPFLRAVQADAYVAVDLSLDCLTETLEAVKAEFPDMASHSRIKNFNTQDFDSAIMFRNGVAKPDAIPEGRRIMVQFGSTLGNVEGFQHDPLPKDVVTAALSNYTSHLRAGDHLILGIDQNQDRQSLDECYSDELNRKFAMAMLDRVAAELPVSRGFSQDDFRFTRLWKPENSLYGLGFEIMNDVCFSIGSERAQFSKGEVILYGNTYKYPQPFLDSLYPQIGSGLKVRDILADPQGRMHHQVLTVS